MGFVGQQAKRRSVADFAEQVSTGKAVFCAEVALGFIPGRRERINLWDLEGSRRLIDCHCPGGVFNLGHRHPAVVAALHQALDRLDIGSHYLISERRAALARRMAELTPGDLPCTTFTVGGGEAIDFALKLARAHTGRSDIVSARSGYHDYIGPAPAAGDPAYHQPVGPMPPGFVQIPFADLEAAAGQINSDTAAVLLETVPATLGMPIAPPDYFAQLRALRGRQGALLIVDEGQSGLGRTGKMWAIEHFAGTPNSGDCVRPDILVIGEGLSGGLYPIAAICYRRELSRSLHENPFIHVSTFGGAEVGCPVALKVLELTGDPALLQRVGELAERFASGFEQLQERYPQTLVGVRQLGLMIGLVFPDHNCGPAMNRLLLDEGVLAIWANNDPRVLQFLPPLIMDDLEAEEVLGALDRALARLSGMRGWPASH